MAGGGEFWFRVQGLGLGFRVWGLEFGVWGLGFEGYVVGCGVFRALKDPSSATETRRKPASRHLRFSTTTYTSSSTMKTQSNVRFLGRIQQVWGLGFRV